MVTFTLDGKVVSAKEGTTILEAARENGIDIPTLCHDKNLSVFGGCRMCIVEVEGAKTLVASCANEVREGMVVQTESEKVVEARKEIIDLLLASHPEDCLTCEQNSICKLQEYAYRYDIKKSSYKGDKREYAIDSLNPVMERDQSKCILCGKCVRVCREVQVTSTIDFAGRGYKTRIATALDAPIDYKNCRLCGQCISVCPTGALVNKQLKGAGPWEVSKVTTTCPFCGVGCNFDLNIKNGKIVGVTPNPESVVNGTSLCVKGRYHTDFIYNPERITTPLIKKDGEFVETTWETALSTVAEKLKEVKKKYGPDAIAGLSSARCTNEENFLFQKMMRVAVGTNNVDHCART